MLILTLSLMSALAHSAPPVPPSWGEWEAAKAYYDSKKFEEARQELVSHFRDDPGFYYNMGTTYYQLGQSGTALAYLEKANRMRPHDADIQYNLSIARSDLSAAIGADKLDPASSWAEQMADRMTLDEVRATLGLFGVIMILLWLRAYLSTRSLTQALINRAGLLGSLAFVITITIYGIQRWTEASPAAISIETGLIRSGPGDQYLELTRADAGTKIRLLGPTAPAPKTAEIWRQVRYSAEGIGWIKASSLLLL